MDEKWNLDFKKFKKNSSKKLLKGGFGFFTSPREEARGNGNSKSGNSDLPSAKKVNNWDNESVNLNSGDAEVPDQDYMDDVPIIPSLDDFADDDLTNQIAKAPLVGVKQVVSFGDLENELLKFTVFSNLEGVNLRVLVKLLHQESHLDESDTPWTKEGLFNEIISAFNERKL